MNEAEPPAPPIEPLRKGRVIQVPRLGVKRQPAPARRPAEVSEAVTVNAFAEAYIWPGGVWLSK